MARKSSSHVEHSASKKSKTDRDELAVLIHDSLNKAATDGATVAHFLDQEEECGN